MGSKCDYCGYGGGYGDSDSDSDGDSDSDLDSDSSEKVIKYFDTLEDDYWCDEPTTAHSTAMIFDITFKIKSETK